jgi:hypothetical protein
MSKLSLELTTTDNLSAGQKEQAERLADRLRATLTSSENLEELVIRFRPLVRRMEDQAIFFPENKQLLIYCSAASSDELSSALETILPALESLVLPVAEDIKKSLLSFANGASPATNRPVIAYWAGPWRGEGSWRARILAGPETYPLIEVDPLVEFLNREAPLPASAELRAVALSYHLYRSGAGPDDGFFHYLREEEILLVDVPIDAALLPPFLDSPARQRYLLSGLLLSFLHLQSDPAIPGLDFRAWKKELERVFRKEV